MTDPARAADTFIDWWAEIKFGRGFIVGFIAALFLVWLSK